MSLNQKRTQALCEGIDLRDAYNAGKISLHQLIIAIQHLEVSEHFTFDRVTGKCIMTHFTMGERDSA